MVIIILQTLKVRFGEESVLCVVFLFFSKCKTGSEHRCQEICLVFNKFNKFFNAVFLTQSAQDYEYVLAEYQIVTFNDS